MGKASRWMINLLLGKKEEKTKNKKNLSFYDKNVTPAATILSSPHRRWSFGKSATKETTHRLSNSLDSVTPLITQHASASLDWGIQPKNKTKVVAISQPVTIKTVKASTKSLQDAAATRIQAALRSYLAKKALRALRGLVKIQALVRGHLVRKQTTATMRQMHALMSIQVRARFQRIQMAEDSSQLVVRSQSSRLANFTHETKPRAPCRDTIDMNIYETDRVLKQKHNHINNSHRESSNHRPRKYYSGELFVSNRDQQYEFSFSTAHNSPQVRSPTATANPGRASFSYQKPDYAHPVPSPNYMSNTESSRAKVRSQSEPKQRPKRKKASNDGINAQIQSLSSQSISPINIMYEEEDPWFIKLHNTTKGKKSDYDAKSAASCSHSNYSKLFVTYEPHLNLY